MSFRLGEGALNNLFFEARTYHYFINKPVEDVLIKELYDLFKWGPTAFNSQPSRYLFLKTADAKKRLEPAISSSNKEKTVQAPLTVIIAYDTQFFEHLPKLTASPTAKSLFEDNPHIVEPTLLKNSSLQIGYLVTAARSLGLDVGVLTGFNADAINLEFFPDGRFKVNMIANIGYGDKTKLNPRGYRFSFDEVAEIL